MITYHILYAVYYKFLLIVHKAISFILSPHHCLRCGEESNLLLCPSCLFQFQNTSLNTRRCSICGKQLISEKINCLNCREEPLLVHTDAVYPIHTYRSWKKELLFKWKMCGNRTVSITAAQVFHAVLQEKFPNIPVVPVPPRPGKIFTQGWDQMQDITAVLIHVYRHSILNLLVRIEKKQQKKLSREERIHQMGHLYQIRKGNISLPDEVVLIDDIMTTGATLEACAVELKKAGIKRVNAVTLFIAD